MSGKILCVAEKPAIAKAVAGHLSGGQVTIRATRNKYVKNYEFSYRFAPPWGQCTAVMTSVLGHTIEWDFTEAHRKWNSCPPSQLFDAPTEQVIKERQDVADNIKAQARGARALFIWTDCDREGEYIGTEVRDIALTVNPRLEVKRAKFSNIERSHILQAALRPVNLDDRQAAAVAARTELDLRIGAAFTRWQTLALQGISGLEDRVISYGSCQFPTLGFVVDRYKRVKNFVSEPFWSIKIAHKKEGVNATFNWDRNRLFDRMVTVLLFERCLQATTARVTEVTTKPTKKWKPLPLTTVELQKLGSRFLGLTSKVVMEVAEKLYTQGFISYPRTETDQFDRNMDLRALVEKQTVSGDWGPYAIGLLNGGFSQPRDGPHNDKAHPPIHPVCYVAPTALRDNNERRVYEFVTRRFLACCSEDALGQSTTVKIAYGDEGFHACGLVVIARNYLDVYPYDKWESSQQLPRYVQGETFVPTEANMTDGKTSPPGYLTEPELITLMDVNGIGTDATMAEHISKIKDREYVFTRAKGRAGAGDPSGGAENEAPAGRGRGRGRGSGRGRSNAAAGRGGGGVEEFVPSSLGIALVEGYDQIGFDNSVTKPFLRKEMEEKMKKICDGTMNKSDVVHESIEQYRDMFVRASLQVEVLKNKTREYMQG